MKENKDKEKKSKIIPAYTTNGASQISPNFGYKSTKSAEDFVLGQAVEEINDHEM